MKKAFIALAIAWVLVFLLRYDTFYFIENPLADKLTVETREVDPRIKILAIDDESLAKIGKWPWPRDLIAETVEKIAQNGATAVWTDVLFTEKSLNPSEDQALARVVGEYDNVYLPVYFEFEALQNSGEDLEHKYSKWPVVEIPEERVGHINIIPDKDQVVREVLLGVPDLDNNIIPIIDVRLANLLLPQESQITWNDDYVWYRGDELIPYNERLQTGFSYASASVESKFEVIPVWKVVEGEIDPAYFEGSIVMIGPYAVGLQDQFMTPTSHIPMYGVEIHANIMQAFLDNSLYSELDMGVALLLLAIIGMLGYALFEWSKAKWGAVILALAVFVYSAIVYYTYTSHGVLLPYFYVIFALILAYITSVIGQYLTERRERERVTSLFGRYVSKSVVDEILSSKEELTVGGVRKDVTLMFVDIRGFTPLAEKMEPEDVITVLNEYLDFCTKSIFRYEGTLDKFIGDGVMSIFGAPIEQNDHSERAVLAALDMKKYAVRLIDDLQERYGVAVYFGIGINSGSAVIGNIGSEERVDYTAIGDTVNLAARLEANAKPGQILISSETYERVKDRFECIVLEPILVKGKEKPVQVYEVIGEKQLR